MSLPPTTQTIFLYILQAHHVVILCKAADQQSPPHLLYTKFDWDVKDGNLILVTAIQPAGPPGLIHVTACSYIA